MYSNPANSHINTLTYRHSAIGQLYLISTIPTIPHICYNYHAGFVYYHSEVQDSIAIAKKTARCTQYMGAVKSFQSPHYARLLFQKFVMDFCSDRY